MPPERKVMTMRCLLIACVGVATACAGVPAAYAQGFGTQPAKPRPWGRVSFFASSSRTSVDGGDTRTVTELTTALSYQLPDVDEGGADYGVDVRYATYSQAGRPARTSLYEGFVGMRFLGGRVRARGGHLWVGDVGALGSVAGAVLELRQSRRTPDAGRFRAGAFGGLEPNIRDIGYADQVTKFGVYGAYDGAGARRHSIGYVAVRQSKLTERSVLTTTHFVPVGRKLFIYQAAEFNLAPPAGLGESGLAYLFANVRVTPTDRVELQGMYNRGRSVDARGLGEDLINGRPIPQRSIDGLQYESGGGRLTVEVLSGVRVYGGVSLDMDNRDTSRTRRIQVGGYASNVARSGFDLTVSESLMQRVAGSYESRYLSVGRQLGRRAYATLDYSSSLSIVRFSRSDGLVIETRPHASRVSATVTASLDRSWSLNGMVERSSGDDRFRDLRLLAGLAYRIR